MTLKDHILKTAVRLARAKGYTHITRDQIATECNCGTGTINYHYGSMPVLLREVMREAIKSADLEIIAQGLAERHPVIVQAPEVLRSAAARYLTA